MLLLAAFACLQLAALAQTVDVNAFEKGIKEKNAQLFDVRTSAEYNSGHLKGALQANYNDKAEFQQRVKYLDKTRPVYVYCLVGGRSGAAAEWMRSNGFTKVINMEGGINAWKKAGKPLEGVSDTPQMTTSAFTKAVANGTVLVDIGAEWCPPCRAMEPVLARLKAIKGLSYHLLKVDGGTDTDVMKSVGAAELPTFIVYKNGKETWRKTGPATLEELENAIK